MLLEKINFLSKINSFIVINNIFIISDIIKLYILKFKRLNIVNVRSFIMIPSVLIIVHFFMALRPIKILFKGLSK